MRIFKATELILLLIFVVSSTTAAPGRFSADSSEPAELPPAGEHYDQRQNGTDNIRVHLDGIVFVVAPVEALLLAGGLGGPESNLLAIPQKDDVTQKPKPEEAISKPIEKPNIEAPVDKLDGKSSQRAGLRLMSLLSPLLRRVQLHQ